MSEEGKNNFAGWLRKQSEVATSLGILLGGAAAIIVFFGGSIPPWYTPAQAQEDSRKAAEIQQETVRILSDLNVQMLTVQRRVDKGECLRLTTTLLQATDALFRRPGDLIALALRDGTQNQMRQIPGCDP